MHKSAAKTVPHATAPVQPLGGFLRRVSRAFWLWLPNRVDTRIRVAAWLSFVAEVLIIATGGAVRLTGSGLGCPTWPTCTAQSLIPTPEMGLHGIIEFGNRTLTGLVGILALAVFILVLKIRRDRRDLFVLSLVVGVGIVAQAIVGGITVRTGLNPFIVGFHYVSSLTLVCVAAAFLVRMSRTTAARVRAVPRWHVALAFVTAAVLVVSITFGVLTTGAGPHSGDVNAGRNGFDLELLEHVHSWPGYALFALTILLAIAAWRARDRAPRLLTWTLTLLGIELVQIAVGLYQARNGLPEVAVGVHMVLAALAVASMTVVLMHLRVPAGARVHTPRIESADDRVGSVGHHG